MYFKYKVGRLGFEVIKFFLNNKKLSNLIIVKKSELYNFLIERNYKKSVLTNIYHTLKKLEKNGFIKVLKSDRRNVFIFLKTKIFKLGEIADLINNSRHAKLCEDGYKMIIVFDIPERERIKRNQFRTFLKLIGYKELQKSVFVGERENIKEVKYIINLLEIKEYVKVGYFKEI